MDKTSISDQPFHATSTVAIKLTLELTPSIVYGKQSTIFSNSPVQVSYDLRIPRNCRIRDCGNLFSYMCHNNCTQPLQFFASNQEHLVL